jgi:hypothetical protein
MLKMNVPDQVIFIYHCTRLPITITLFIYNFLNLMAILHGSRHEFHSLCCSSEVENPEDQLVHQIHHRAELVPQLN